ncbi:MAG: tRNA dihydrouridine synthase DusB [Eubacteriales bacterium]|nr:tRNA dihydrouridine synthase DusB [Eubacteriales bacterium]
MSLYHSLRIGPLLLDGPLALAPMAGTTDQVFRAICRENGASLTVTELVSVRGICHDPELRRTWRYIAIDPDENPVAIQLFGSETDDFRQALDMILSHPILSRCAAVDLNMGCPVNKVVRAGDGCALMQQPERAEQIVRVCADLTRTAGLPLTVKFRKGWDEQSVNAVDFARRCEAAGAAAVTIHGRTRQQMYSGKADWTIIAAVRDAVSIPVFGNGDVTSGASAEAMLRQTGVDGLMIGRAAQGNPWIFQEIADWLKAVDRGQRPYEGRSFARDHAGPGQRVAMMRRHLSGLIELHGETAAIRQMRGQAAAYMKGIPHGAHFRARAVQTDTEKDFLAVLEEWQFYCQKYCEHS